MQQPVHRTLRTITPVLRTDKRRPPVLLSLPGAPAILLLVALAALGWRAENAALLPHITLPFASSPATSSPSAPLPRYNAPRSGPSSAVSSSRHAGASPNQTAHTARQSTVAAPRVQALAPAQATLAPAKRSRAAGMALPPISPSGDALRVAMAPNPTFTILAQPSVSVAVIRAELKRYNSPLLTANWSDGKDAAQYIWDAGRVLGIDPAVLLAFFWHESHYGTRGMARLTDSVGNLRPLAGQPQLNGYRFYRTWQESVDDTYRLLGEYARHGASSVATALPVWAPPADGNNVTSYVADVQDTMARYYALSEPGSTAQRSATADLATN